MATILKNHSQRRALQSFRQLTPITLYYDAEDATALKTLDLFL